MKRFIIACCCLAALAFAGAYLHFQLGLDLWPAATGPDEVAAPFFQEGRRLYRRLGEGAEPLEIRGVELGAGLPGHFPTDYAIDRETYLRWFGRIRDLGANCLRIRTVLGTAFYEALYEFNRENPDPLYLLHGVLVDDYANDSHLSALDRDFLAPFKEDVRATVDVCHGNRPLQLGRLSGSGVYTRDVSPWVLGYLLGTDWNPVTVAYTNLVDDDHPGFQGEYLGTAEDATPFEAMLAEVGEEALAYETARYGEQRLVSFANAPRTDPFEYPEAIRASFGAYASIDVEAIRATDRVQSGLFASYALRSGQADHLRHLPELASRAESTGDGGILRTYLELLGEHHAIPLVVSEVGVPSSRGATSVDGSVQRLPGPLDEHGQALALVRCLRDIAEAGAAGCVVSTWQDEWHRRSWNTWTNVDLLQAPRWSDCQTEDQGFGLLAFDPGAEGPAAVVDGDPGEWTEVDVIGEGEGVELSLRTDEEFLHLLAKGSDVGPDRPLYLPFDVTPKSGAPVAEAVDGRNPALAFERPADFLLVLDGERNSRLLVQERYETLRATKLRALADVDPYDEVPGRESPVFRSILLMLDTPGVRPEPGSDGSLAELSLRELGAANRRYPDVYETGLLVHGDADPASPDFDSLADFHYGEGCVEVRLPWQLLNFSNPSAGQVHDDYYERYGVENLAVESIWVGVGRGSGPIGLFEAALEPWGGQVTYRERLKEAYDLLRSIWAGGASFDEALAEARGADGDGLDSAGRPEVIAYRELYYPDLDAGSAE